MNKGDNGIQYPENVRDMLVGILERYDILSDEYFSMCDLAKQETGNDYFDPDAYCTPLEHAIYCLAHTLGYDSRELYKEAVENRKNKIHTSFAKVKSL